MLQRELQAASSLASQPILSVKGMSDINDALQELVFGLGNVLELLRKDAIRQAEARQAQSSQGSENEIMIQELNSEKLSR